MSESLEKGSNERIEKARLYRELTGNAEAIFLLPTSEREAQEHVFRPDSYTVLDNKGYLAGGHARTIATAEAARYMPETRIVTMSSPEAAPESLARIYAEELKRLGVAGESIILEENSHDTISELVECLKISKDKGWSKIALVTNDYHVDRVNAMLDHIEDLATKFGIANDDLVGALSRLRSGELSLKVVAAEDILPHRDRRFASIIENVRATDAYKNRVEAEKRGIAQIKDGTYGDR